MEESRKKIVCRSGLVILCLAHGVKEKKNSSHARITPSTLMSDEQMPQRTSRTGINWKSYEWIRPRGMVATARKDSMFASIRFGWTQCTLLKLIWGISFSIRTYALSMCVVTVCYRYNAIKLSGCSETRYKRILIFLYPNGYSKEKWNSFVYRICVPDGSAKSTAVHVYSFISQFLSASCSDSPHENPCVLFISCIYILLSSQPLSKTHSGSNCICNYIEILWIQS